MKPTTILRWAWRDIATGAARTAAHCAVFTLLVGALLGHELFTVTSIIDGANRFQQAGANVRVVIAEGRIDGPTCAALADGEGVESAALRSLPDQLRPTAMSSVPLLHVAATPGIDSVLRVQQHRDRGSATAGVYVGTPVFESFGGAVRVIATDQGALPIAGVYPYPEDGRRGGMGYAVIAPETVRSAPYDECWLSAWPEPDQAQAALSTAVRSTGTSNEAPPQFTQLNTTLGQHYPGARLFAQRLSKYNAAAALAVGALTGSVVVRRRRLELAAALHAGVRRTDLLKIQCLQYSVWVGLSGAFALAAAAPLISEYPGASPQLTELALRICGFAAAGALIGVSVTTSAIREASLFAYFKGRE